MGILSFLTLFFIPFGSFITVAGSSGGVLVPKALLPSIDICAYLDLDLFAKLLIIGQGSSHLSICLCVSTVRPSVQANVVTRAAIKTLTPVLGATVAENAVVTVLLGLINKNGRECRYPAHAMPLCQPGAPCSFGCTDGYSRVGNTCVCPAPKIECNNVCQSQACSSAVPKNPGKRSASSQARSRMRVLTDERCARGQRLCGAGGVRNRGGKDWECIDTTRALDSCGGCTYPFTLDDSPIEGIDCSSLPGVSGVECRGGRCLVHHCERGWSIAPSRSRCLPSDGETHYYS